MRALKIKIENIIILSYIILLMVISRQCHNRKFIYLNICSKRNAYLNIQINLKISYNYECYCC